VTPIDVAAIAGAAAVVAVYVTLRLRPPPQPPAPVINLILNPVGPPAPPGNPPGPETEDMPLSQQFQDALDRVKAAHVASDAAKDQKISDLQQTIDTLKTGVAADAGDEIAALDALASDINPPAADPSADPPADPMADPAA
jgi:hypothetical protein